jgi:hypothetical protein
VGVGAGSSSTAAGTGQTAAGHKAVQLISQWQAG